MFFGLFLISAAILALEVLHMRIFTVQMWYHHAYMVVTMAMLGFAVSGTVVTLWPGAVKERVNSLLGWCSTLFGLLVVLAHVLISQVAYGDWTILGYGILLVPYFFGGMVITLALSSGEKIHGRYFINLFGSAVGAWLFILTITPLGGERLLMLCAVMGPISALLFLQGTRNRVATRAAMVAIVGLVAMLVIKPDFMRIRINPEKKQHLQGTIREERWTPLSRLDLFWEDDDRDKNPTIHIVQDGAAGSIMYSDKAWKSFPPYDSHVVHYAPHLIRMKNGAPRPRVLIVGVGGGGDLRVASEVVKAQSVLGIELNQEMMNITGRDFADYNGNIYGLPGVKVINGEGRSTLQRLDEKFDVIYLAGVDTYTAGASGAFVLSEAFLYTEEALRVYLDHLKPGGTVGILRFYDKPPRETLRLFGMILRELRRRGIKDPTKNVAIVRSTWSSGTVFSLSPLEPEAVAFFKGADQEPTDLKPTDPPTPDLYSVLYVPGLEEEIEDSQKTPFTEFATAFKAGKDEEFYDNYVVDIRPVSDDNPFFFNFHHMWDMAEYEDSAFAREFNATMPVAPSILRNLLIQILICVAVLVVLPLLILRRGGLKSRHTGRHLTYFLALGAGFMFLEISTIQRLILFLGHPTYSFTVVLFCFLFFAGLGSLLSGKIVKDPARGAKFAIIILSILILAVTFGLDTVLASFLHLSLGYRILLAIGLLAPLNLIMGMPFPLGLTRLRQEEPKLVPWAIGANGGAGVFGSVLAVGLAMESGFTLVAFLSFVIYFVGMLAVSTGPLAKKPPTDS